MAIYGDITSNRKKYQTGDFFFSSSSTTNITQHMTLSDSPALSVLSDLTIALVQNKPIITNGGSPTERKKSLNVRISIISWNPLSGPLKDHAPHYCIIRTQDRGLFRPGKRLLLLERKREPLKSMCSISSSGNVSSYISSNGHRNRPSCQTSQRKWLSPSFT